MNHLFCKFAVSLAAVVSFALCCIPTQAQTFTVLYTIPGDQYASGPLWGVIEDAAGNLYGTTSGGGADGTGDVFQLNTSGHASVLYSFSSTANGASPASLLRDANGTFFGNTYYGGDFFGFGTIFELSDTGQETVLHKFQGQADGAYPQSPLLQDAEGNLYGTAYGYGGTSDAGTIFKIAQGGKFSVLHSFTAGSDGCAPSAGLILGSDGNFYGTTAGCGANGYGTIFTLTPAGKKTVLYAFTGNSDEYPEAPLMQDASGNLFGTTNGGNYTCGTVFRLSKSGTETVLHTFSRGGKGGCNSTSELVEDAEGNLYGTTRQGGLYDSGTVFKLTPSGVETILHHFTGGTDGGFPLAGLLQDPAGNLYGTTEYGGEMECGSASDNFGCGVVFEITP